MVYGEADKGFGNAIITQLCIEESSSCPISQPEDPEQRSLLVVKLLVTALTFPNISLTPVHVGVTHLENTKCVHTGGL